MICQTFRKLAAHTWNEIRKSRKAGFQLKEETLTDKIILELKLKHRHEVTVKVFDKSEEGKTGADWEWWFTDSDEWIGLRVQAKVINIVQQGFSHLHYKNRNGVFQSQLLLESALRRGGVKLMPLYCLYTHVSSRSVLGRSHAYAIESSNVWGCSLVSAFHVSSLRDVNCHLISELADFMYPWHTLVCSDTPNLSGKIRRMDEHIVRVFDPINTFNHQYPDFPRSFITTRPPSYVQDMIEQSAKGLSRTDSIVDQVTNRLLSMEDGPDAEIKGVVVFNLGKEKKDII